MPRKESRSPTTQGKPPHILGPPLPAGTPTRPTPPSSGRQAGKAHPQPSAPFRPRGLPAAVKPLAKAKASWPAPMKPTLMVSEARPRPSQPALERQEQRREEAGQDPAQEVRRAVAAGPLRRQLAPLAAPPAPLPITAGLTLPMAANSSGPVTTPTSRPHWRPRPAPEGPRHRRKGGARPHPEGVGERRGTTDRRQRAPPGPSPPPPS